MLVEDVIILDKIPSDQQMMTSAESKTMSEMDLKKFNRSFENLPDDIKQMYVEDLLEQGLELCRSSFNGFDVYFQLMERLIEEALEHEVGFRKQTADKLPEEKQDHFWMWNYPVYLENLSPLLRSSFLIALYSLFENELRTYCRILKDFEKIPLNSSNWAGSNIEKAKKYIHKTAGYIILDEELWNELNDFRLVRNCIVHKDGFINEDGKLRSIVSKYQEIWLEYDRIIPSEKYCERMLTKCRQLLENLYNELLKRIK